MTMKMLIDDLTLAYCFRPSDLLMCRLVLKEPLILKIINKEHKPKKNLMTHDKRKMWVIECIYDTTPIAFETTYMMADNFFELCYNTHEKALEILDEISRSTK